MAIPYGTIDFESEAQKLYEGDERERLFAEAYEPYPGYQELQLFDAIDYIMDGFDKNLGSRYSDTEWQAISDHLAEHVHNGLT
jgi:hypothetical protein